MTRNEIDRFVGAPTPRPRSNLFDAAMESCLRRFDFAGVLLGFVSMFGILVYHWNRQSLSWNTVSLPAKLSLLTVPAAIVVVICVSLIKWRYTAQLLARGKFIHGRIDYVRSWRGGHRAHFLVTVLPDGLGGKERVSCIVRAGEERRRCMDWQSRQTDVGLLYLPSGPALGWRFVDRFFCVYEAVLTDLWER
jgi:hypothetical protein